MARVVRSPPAKRDIVDVLRFTKQRWGITEALIAVANDPKLGKPREDIRAGILAHHIAQRGRPARHILIYRVDATGTVEVLRLLHDAMDFARHVP